MSIFVEDNEYTKEVMAELAVVADPLVAHSGQCSGQLGFLPPAVVAGGDNVSSNRYFRLDYPAPTPPNDVGAQLVSKLANHQPKHIFIHGVVPTYRWTYYDTRGGTYSKTVGEEGGGFTTDLKSKPHVDLYVDGTEQNDRYPITITTLDCFVSIHERPTGSSSVGVAL